MATFTWGLQQNELTDSFFESAYFSLKSCQNITAYSLLQVQGFPEKAFWCSQNDLKYPGQWYCNIICSAGKPPLVVSISQSAITCSKLTIQTLEQGAKYVKS